MEYKEVRYYKHQNNTINAKFMCVDNINFRLSGITTIFPTGIHYNSSNYRISGDEEPDSKKEFNFICDGQGYMIIADPEMTDKIYEKMIQWVFPPELDKEKVFI